MASPKRNNTKRTHDSASVVSALYNEAAGAEKNIQVGPHLKPIRTGTSSFSTDASGGRTVPAGTQLALYNNANAVAAITVSAESVAALAAGVTDANGNVGIPCAPNTWTYVSVWDKTFIATTAATLMVFIIEDDTKVSV